jgi:glycosyltransferase involved in cell wall biosynthesis
MRSFSILVCTYPAPPSLEILLSSLQRQNWQPGDEFILVDNGVSEPRKTEVKALVASLSPYLETHYVEEPAPGLGAARLAGFRRTTGDWILLLDDDNELTDGCVETLRKFVQENAELGGVCPAIYAEWKNEPPRWLRKASTEFLSVNHAGEFIPRFPRTIWSAAEGIPMRPPGGGMVIRAEVAKGFVRLSEEQPVYVNMGRTRGSMLGCEDEVIYSITNFLGYSTAYVPEVKVKHHLPATRSSMKYLCKLAFSMSVSNSRLRRIRKPHESTWSRLRISFFALASVRKSVRWGLRSTIIAFAKTFGLLSGLWLTPRIGAGHT